MALVFALIAASTIDAAATLRSQAEYQHIGIPFSPIIKAAIAAAWTVVLSVLAVGLLRRRHAAFSWTAPILTLYALAGLLWEIAFVHSDYGRGRLGFVALLSAITLAPVWWIAVRKRWLWRESSRQVER